MFGILGEENDDNKANTVATQVAALTYQSQLTQSTAANMAQLSAVQDATHATLHQLIDGMNALVFNASDADHGRYVGHGYGGRGHGHAACRAVGVTRWHTLVESPT